MSPQVVWPQRQPGSGSFLAPSLLMCDPEDTVCGDALTAEGPGTHGIHHPPGGARPPLVEASLHQGCGRCTHDALTPAQITRLQRPMGINYFPIKWKVNWPSNEKLPDSSFLKLLRPARQGLGCLPRTWTRGKDSRRPPGRPAAPCGTRTRCSSTKLGPVHCPQRSRGSRECGPAPPRPSSRPAECGRAPPAHFCH